MDDVLGPNMVPPGYGSQALAYSEISTRYNSNILADGWYTTK